MSLIGVTHRNVGEGFLTEAELLTDSKTAASPKPTVAWAAAHESFVLFLYKVHEITTSLEPNPVSPGHSHSYIAPE